ncbi:MAG: molybdopterin-synthase adenylyltransferase MoeB [Myxococcota bacterium]
MGLRPDQLERYKRHLFLDEVGPEGQEKLLVSRVLLVGAGGLGSPAALYLAAAGVGTLGLVDFDCVDASNLQRQVLYGTSDVGRPKLEVALERLGALNPDVQVVPHEARLAAANAEEILGGYDVILDGTDTFPSRYLTNDVCVWLERPLVYGSVMRFEGQVSVFDARRGPCYRCLFPEPPPPELAPSCAEAGVLGVLPGVIGLLQATEVLKLLLGRGSPLVGRLLVYDALAMEFREFSLAKDLGCAVCGASPSIHAPIDYEAFCASAAGDAEPIPEVSPSELARRLSAGDELLILDVREPFEAEAAQIPGARLIPLGELEAALSSLGDWKERPVVVHCHHGVRSRRAGRLLRERGFSCVESLEGGIDAWSREVDSSVPRY